MSLRNRALATGTAFGLLCSLAVAAPAQAASQSINYYMNGDCSDYYDEMGEYAFFEDEVDWNCYITVKVTPLKPARTVRLQYWNDRKWVQEMKAVTNAKGVARLDFDPYCNDDLYCDGTWTYRVYVDAVTGQSYKTSNKFEMTYYPMDTGEDDEYSY